ncbi:MAG: 2-hydroxymuconic semialdehyde dehydrogenase [Alphaproteobacteria bacterium]|nr:MAG: 2-hydroxymuconic semialdehyde dehydrogenase [Alphaproteobacteria bacterium]
MSNRKILNFIDGEYTEGTSGKSFEVINPVDGSISAVVTEASAADVDRAVTAARAALEGEWGQMAVKTRLDLLDAVADGIMAHQQDFIDAEISDTGKPYGQVAHMEIPRAADQFRVFLKIVAAGGKNEIIDTLLPDGGVAHNREFRKPKGVIAAVCPWNLPLVMATWKAAPALAWGNTMVLKPSEETPSTAALLGMVMNEAGIPKGVFNVVHGFGENSAGGFLVAHPGVDAINFTGETRTGEAIMKSSAVGLRDVSLELGGKNPCIVFADCNFAAAIEGIAKSCFFNCGQICLGTERLYVEQSIFDKFVVALKNAAESQTIGPAVGPTHQKKILSYYRLAEQEGATVVTGGGIPKVNEALVGGAWVQPTIWTGLPEKARLLKEEVFGPCCHIQPFVREEDAIRMANDSLYGLAACVWSGDEGKARRVAEALNVGVCWINGWMVRDLRTAFGGVGMSGIGREGGIYSMEFHTELKNICTIMSPATV